MEFTASFQSGWKIMKTVCSRHYLDLYQYQSRRYLIIGPNVPLTIELSELSLEACLPI